MRMRLVLLFILIAAPVLRGAAVSPQQLWLYCSQNLWVDQNITEMEALWRRAARAGYTHVLLADSKFSKLEDMDARYFKNVERLKKLAAELGLEIVPALFSVGYSNDLLWHDPNLAEGLPVRDLRLKVEQGVARPEPSAQTLLKGGDFSDLKLWDWKDATVTAENGAARIDQPKGQNARIVQKLELEPFRQYHLTVRIKTAEFRGTPEVKVIAGKRTLNFNPLGVKRTQDWTAHHVTFNSLEHREANLYLGCWGGESGTVWFDDAQLEQVAWLNLIRRPGAPLEIRDESGRALEEGRDYAKLLDPLMGSRPWKGEFDVWHEPPVLETSLADGTRLRASYYHAATVYAGQAMICPSEPRTVELLRDQARRMHRAWGARGYMMSHDEIRVLNWCQACEKRGLSAGAILADNVKTCIGLLREVNPAGRIYVWSDMFDPNHNAHDDYYLVRGTLAGSWEGLDAKVVIVPWYFEKRTESLKWFAGRGHAQVIAGYYDANPDQVREWLSAAAPYSGVEGVLYTTWQRNFADIERFGSLVKAPR